jgi:hypothetical protein
MRPETSILTASWPGRSIEQDTSAGPERLVPAERVAPATTAG